MNSRLKNILELIKDVKARDEGHLLLKPIEILAMKIVKLSGEVSYNMFFHYSENDEGKATISYSSVRIYLVQLYVDVLLLSAHTEPSEVSLALEEVSESDDFRESTVLEIIHVLQAGVTLLVKSIHKSDKVAIHEVIEFFRLYIAGALDLYGVDKNEFYEDVEEYIYDQLLIDLTQAELKASLKLSKDFRGKTTVILEGKVDKRRRLPFVGIFVKIDSHTTKFFEMDNPYIGFINIVKYLKKTIGMSDITFEMNEKVKIFFNKYNLMYINGDKLQAAKDKDASIVLVSKETKDVDTFLELLTENK